MGERRREGGVGVERMGLGDRERGQGVEEGSSKDPQTIIVTYDFCLNAFRQIFQKSLHPSFHSQSQATRFAKPDLHVKQDLCHRPRRLDLDRTTSTKKTLLIILP